MRRLGKIGSMISVLFSVMVVLSAGSVSAQVFVTFSPGEYAAHFTDLLGGGDIVSQKECPPGPGLRPEDVTPAILTALGVGAPNRRLHLNGLLPMDCTTDLGPSGHVALNMVGKTPPLTRLTQFTPGGQLFTMDNGTVCVDCGLFRNGNYKGCGPAALLGGGPLGVAVVVTDEGADDRLQLLTVNTTTGVTVIKDQATPGNGRAPLNMRNDHGSTDGQAFGGLFYAPNGPSWHNNVNWQRVCLSFAVGVGGVLTLDGSVTSHVPPDPNKPKDMWDPDAPLVSSGPMARVHFLGLIPGVGTSGSTGLIGVANGLDGISQSYTNFSVSGGELPPPPPPPCTPTATCPCTP